MESRTREGLEVVEKPSIDRKGSMEEINAAMINHAREIAQEIGATAVLVYVDVIKSRGDMESLLEESRCIVAVRNQDVIDDLTTREGVEGRIIQVPHVNLTRLSQIKVAAILALSNGLIKSGDRLVCLSGSPRYGIFDNLTVMDVDREFEILSSKTVDIASQMELPHVFDRLLTIALELAEEGREGKPLGTIFVLGDHEKVMEMSSQMVINPFGGVQEAERNIMDSELKETIREFAAIDGAFVIRDDGAILAAGRHLKASAEDADLPQGLGSRHRAAAGITALTNA